MSYSSAILLALFTPYERTPDLESVNNIKMLQFSKKWVKNSHCGIQNLIRVLFNFKKYSFFPKFYEHILKCKTVSKISLSRTGYKSCATGWIFRWKIRSFYFICIVKIKAMKLPNGLRVSDSVFLHHLMHISPWNNACSGTLKAEKVVSFALSSP